MGGWSYESITFQQVFSVSNMRVGVPLLLLLAVSPLSAHVFTTPHEIGFYKIFLFIWQ